MMQLGDHPITIGRANDIEVSHRTITLRAVTPACSPQGSRWFLRT